MSKRFNVWKQVVAGLAIFLLLTSSSAAADPNVEKRLPILEQGIGVRTDAELRSFADELYEKEEYFNAVTFYEFLLRRMKDARSQEDLRYRIGLCYEQGKRWEEAERAFRDYLLHHPNGSKAAEARYRIGQGYFRGQQYERAADQFTKASEEITDKDFAAKSQYALALSRIRLGNLSLSRDDLKRVVDEYPSHPLAERARLLGEELALQPQIEHRSPWLAGGLSVIPGLGKVYTGHYGGAAIAFLVNAGLGFVTYDSFANDRQAVGAIFGTLLAATYSANFVGGYRSAIRFNSQAEDRFADRIISKGIVPDLGLTP